MSTEQAPPPARADSVLPFLQIANTSLKCTVCFDIFNDPVAFPCTHIFCSACAERFLADRPQCPLCNASVTNRRRLVSLPAVRELCELLRSAARRLATDTAVHDALAALPATPVPVFHTPAHPMVAETQALPRPSLTAGANHGGDSSDSDSEGRGSSGRNVDRSAVGAASVSAAAAPAAMALFSPAYRLSVALRSGNQRLQAQRNTGALKSSLCYGPCVLCGIDIRLRSSVRAYLRELLLSSAGCDPSDIAALNEERFAAVLGPVWAVQLSGDAMVTYYAHHNCLAWWGAVADFVSIDSHAADMEALVSQKRSREEGGDDDNNSNSNMMSSSKDDKDNKTDRSGHSVGETHEKASYLSMRVVRVPQTSKTPQQQQKQQQQQQEQASGRVTNTKRGGNTRGVVGRHAHKPSAPPASTPSHEQEQEQEEEREGRECCGVCGRPGLLPSSVSPTGGLRGCVRCQQPYHYPCALLASAETCIAFGIDEPEEATEVWCGSCYKQQNR